MRVEVAYSPRAGVVDVVPLDLAEGATVAVALTASGLLRRHGLDPAALRIGVWCKVKETGTALREGDRVEIYRPLLVDPKEARRQRYKRHLELATARDKAKAAPPSAP